MKTEKKHFTADFELKSLDENGRFSGYASVFGVKDYGDDIVVKGAFARSLAELAAKERKTPILWQHDWTQPLGAYEVLKEDEKGLYVEGMLLHKDVALAAEAYALLKAQVITGMSIGYSVVKSARDEQTGVRELLDVELWEISLVTFPMNDEARIDAVKGALIAGDLPTLADFEGFLRDHGFKRKHATAIASRGLKGLLQSESADLESQSESAKMALDIINSFTKELSHGPQRT